jgi:hypothetical protein
MDGKQRLTSICKYVRSAHGQIMYAHADAKFVRRQSVHLSSASFERLTLLFYVSCEKIPCKNYDFVDLPVP